MGTQINSGFAGQPFVVPDATQLAGTAIGARAVPHMEAKKLCERWSTYIPLADVDALSAHLRSFPPPSFACVDYPGLNVQENIRRGGSGYFVTSPTASPSDQRLQSIQREVISRDWGVFRTLCDGANCDR